MANTPQEATNSIPCNNSTFGDLVIDTPKTCYVQCDPGARFGDIPMTCYVTGGLYAVCGERSDLQLQRAREVVLYGADGKFAYQKATDGVVCDSAKFNNLKVDGAMCYTK